MPALITLGTFRNSVRLDAKRECSRQGGTGETGQDSRIAAGKRSGKVSMVEQAELQAASKVRYASMPYILRWPGGRG